MTQTSNNIHISWANPIEVRERARTESALGRLLSLIDGSLPPSPVATVLGIVLTEAESGRVVFEMIPEERHLNSALVVQGGVLGVLSDAALGNAVGSTLQDGESYTTLDYHVNLTRSVNTGTGKLRCEARILHRGSRTATASSSITDLENRLVAHATTTCAIFTA